MSNIEKKHNNNFNKYNSSIGSTQEIYNKPVNIGSIKYELSILREKIKDLKKSLKFSFLDFYFKVIVKSAFISTIPAVIIFFIGTILNLDDSLAYLTYKLWGLGMVGSVSVEIFKDIMKRRNGKQNLSNCMAIAEETTERVKHLEQEQETKQYMMSATSEYFANVANDITHDLEREYSIDYNSGNGVFPSINFESTDEKGSKVLHKYIKR